MNLYKKLQSIFYKPWATHYLKKDRTYHWDGLSLLVKKGVFHPRFFYSSKYFARFIKSQDLLGKSFLDIGSGSGILGMVAARSGANVTSIDISKAAVENTEMNFEKNGLEGQFLQSDLFDSLPKKVFDVVVINPPYYPKNIRTESEYAWHCGENHEYFERLFKGLAVYTEDKTCIYMILSTECDLNRIEELAKKSSWKLIKIDQNRINLEWNYIFQVKRDGA